MPRVQRDTEMARLLLEFEADGHLPFLLDIVPPRAGTLFATKVSVWACIRAACLLTCPPTCCPTPMVW